MKTKYRKKKLSHTSKIDPSFGLQMNLGKQLENKINFYRNKTLKKNGEMNNIYKEENNDVSSLSSSISSSDIEDNNSIENNLKFYENFINEISKEESAPKKKINFPPKKDVEMTPKSIKHSGLKKKAMQYNLTPINEEGNKNDQRNNNNEQNKNNASQSVVMPRLSALEVKNEENFSINESKLSKQIDIKKINEKISSNNNSNSENESENVEKKDNVLALNENKSIEKENFKIPNNLKRARHRSMMCSPNDIQFIQIENKRRKQRMNSVLVENSKEIKSNCNNKQSTSNDLLLNRNDSKSKEVNDNNKNVILPSTNTIKTFSHSNSLSRQSNGTLNQKKKKKLLFCCIPIN